MNLKSLNQADISQAVSLLKTANNTKYVLVPELARELKVSKLDITNHVLNNPKLFYAENIFLYKKVKVKRQLWPGDRTSIYTTTESKRDRSLGMGILSVYLSAVENYRTEEWLEKRIIDFEKYIHISEVDNYGHIEGYYLPTDVKPKENDTYRFWKWRNTEIKLQWLKDNGFTHDSSFVMGGFGDSYTWKSPNGISKNSIEKLVELGWKTNEYKPLEKYVSH